MTNLIVNDLRQIFKKCVSSVLPEKLIRNSLKYDESAQVLSVSDYIFDLKNKNIYVVGMGKAVQNMAKETENVLGTKIIKGIVSIPKGSLIGKSSHGKLVFYEGAENNLPDKDAETTAIKVNDLVSNLGDNDLLLVLISGGGSALLPLPYGRISLLEKTSFIKKLANAGADITELNTVRKKISDLKGGKLAIKAQPAQVVSLILSDIVGDPIDLIASGPTVHNLDGPFEAQNIAQKYKIYDDLPQAIKIVLNSINEKDAFPTNNVMNFIIGSNKLCIEEAFKEATKLNYLAFMISNNVTGNVKWVAERYIELTKIFCDLWSQKISVDSANEQLKRLKYLGIPKHLSFGIQNNTLNNLTDSEIQKTKNICLIMGGETTVEVTGTGKGGRNQELALQFSSLVESCQEFDYYDIFLLSAGTDGIDGPTDAAGAIGYKGLVHDSKQENLNMYQYLNNNDSYNFYKQFRNGDLHIITGHTNTNVMDIHLIIMKLKNLE